MRKIVSGSLFGLSQEISGVLYALVLAMLYAVAGYWSVNYASKKAFSLFVGIIFGTMVARLVTAITIIWFLMAIVGVHQLSFSLTFLISYFIFLMVEILYINKRYTTLVAEHRQKLTGGVRF